MTWNTRCDIDSSAVPSHAHPVSSPSRYAAIVAARSYLTHVTDMTSLVTNADPSTEIPTNAVFAGAVFAGNVIACGVELYVTASDGFGLRKPPFASWKLKNTVPARLLLHDAST
jgi:hypothetical protein